MCVFCHHDSTNNAKEYDGSTPPSEFGNIKKKVKHYDVVIIIKQHESG